VPRSTTTFAISLAAAVLLATACHDEAGVGSGGTGGTGQGGAGGCPTGPHAAFTLTITAADGPVPEDTALEITWSAGKQSFELDQPSTWKTLEDGNLVCDVDRKHGPPVGLEKLVCELWTSGAADLVVIARGYQKRTQTLSPTMSERCNGPLTTDVAIELVRPTPDAGVE
jgi:hypothetical protein